MFVCLFLPSCCICKQWRGLYSCLLNSMALSHYTQFQHMLVYTATEVQGSLLKMHFLHTRISCTHVLVVSNVTCNSCMFSVPTVSSYLMNTCTFHFILCWSHSGASASDVSWYTILTLTRKEPCLQKAYHLLIIVCY